MNSFEIIISIVILIASGYLLKSLNILSSSDSKALTALVINITLPATIFTAMLGKIQASDLSGYLKCTLITLLVSLICISIAYLIGTKLNFNRKSLYTFMLVCSVGSTAFMGYPIVTSYFCDDGLIRAIFCDASTFMVLGTVSTILGLKLTGKKANILTSILKFPPVTTWLFSMILICFGFSLSEFPSLITYTIKVVSLATTPLIMFSIGLSLSTKSIKEYFKIGLIVATIRLLVAPITALSFTNVFELTGLDRQVTILQASMPPALAPISIAEAWGMDTNLVATSIFIATIIAMITIPVIHTLLTTFL